MATFDLLAGRKGRALDPGYLAERRAAHSRALIDLGTGQGLFVLDHARENPDWLCIGIDAAADPMAKSARRAAASPKKGGLSNAVFIRGAAEKLPGPFADFCDRVTVHYPWGSLMGIVAAPDSAGLKAIRAICREGAELSVLLNQSVFEDRDYLARLGFGDIADPARSDSLIAAYQAAGFAVSDRAIFHGDPPIRSRWGRQLVRGSARTTLMIDAIAV